jgi:hypothetical protein
MQYSLQFVEARLRGAFHHWRQHLSGGTAKRHRTSLSALPLACNDVVVSLQGGSSPSKIGGLDFIESSPNRRLKLQRSAWHPVIHGEGWELQR